jgi:flagellar hook-associated protein 1 FlgK
MSGLFSTFNVATRGMSAQQKALDVTAHNIANANTEGYSRQRATMETTTPFGMPSMNNSVGVGQLGTGVQVSSIVRIRDTFLDYQVRTENGTKGWYEGREKFLTEIESIINEPSDTGVSTLVGKMFDSFQELSKHPESSNSRTIVAQQSRALTDELNNTYNQLVMLKGNSQEVIKQTIVDVNNMLDQINLLNQQVISVKVGGNEPNDLMDKRDLLVDQLSSKFGITIDKKSFSGENLKTAEDGGMGNSYLIKSSLSEEIRRFSYINTIVATTDVEDANGKIHYAVTYNRKADMSSEEKKVTINMELTSKEYADIDQSRVLWADSDGYAIDSSGDRIDGVDSTGTAVPAGITGSTKAATVENIKLFQPEKGELKGYMSVQADIDVYIDKLNKLAKGIALSVNAVHSGESNATKYDLMFFINSEDKTTGGETDIDAGNISINGDMLEDVMKIKVGQGANPGVSDGNRALAIAMLRDVRLDVQSIKDTTTRNDLLNPLSGSIFKMDSELGVNIISSSIGGMTVNSYFKDTVNRLGVQTQEAKRVVKNHEALLASLDESRMSISGVSLDEEMANMIQYQHAYQANAKIISTIDELLDVIINGLKR